MTEGQASSWAALSDAASVQKLLDGDYGSTGAPQGLQKALDRTTGAVFVMRLPEGVTTGPMQVVLAPDDASDDTAGGRAALGDGLAAEAGNATALWPPVLEDEGALGVLEGGRFGSTGSSGGRGARAVLQMIRVDGRDCGMGAMGAWAAKPNGMGQSISADAGMPALSSRGTVSRDAWVACLDAPPAGVPASGVAAPLDVEVTYAVGLDRCSGGKPGYEDASGSGTLPSGDIRCHAGVLAGGHDFAILGEVQAVCEGCVEYGTVANEVSQVAPGLAASLVANAAAVADEAGLSVRVDDIVDVVLGRAARSPLQVVEDLEAARDRGQPVLLPALQVNGLTGGNGVGSGGRRRASGLEARR